MPEAEELTCHLHSVYRTVRDQWQDVDELMLTDRERRAVRVEIRRTRRTLVDLLQRLGEPDADETQGQVPTR